MSAPDEAGAQPTREELADEINKAVQLGRFEEAREVFDEFGVGKLSDLPVHRYRDLHAALVRVTARGPASVKALPPESRSHLNACIGAARNAAESPVAFDDAITQVLGVYVVCGIEDLAPALVAPFLRDVAAQVLSIEAAAALPAFEFAGCPQARILPRATPALLARIEKNLPAELLAPPIFVGCDRTPVKKQNGVIKSSKAPLSARTGAHAKSNDPATWGTFAEAHALALRDPRVATVGVNLLGTDFLGLDFDDVIDSHGAVHPLVVDLLDELPPSYIERSPSGCGLRLFFRGRKPDWMHGNQWDLPDGAGSLEVYDCTAGRYLTVTGDVLDRGCA